MKFEYIENLVDFLYTKIEYYYDGMNIETQKPLFILIEKIDEDIIMLFENLEVENQYLFDI